VLFLLAFPAIIPSSPSSLFADSADPPHNMTKASKPLTLMPRLLVLPNTEAMTGKSSFFIVLKSRIGKIAGRLLRAESTIEWVGDSIASWIMGNISIDDQSCWH